MASSAGGSSSKYYRDYKYFLSYSVNLDVTLMIASLELSPYNLSPSSLIVKNKDSCAYEIEEKSHESLDDQNKEQNDLSLYDDLGLQQLTDSAESIRNSPQSEYFITSQLFSDGISVHPMPISTRNPPRCNGTTITWNEWITLPVKYRDLPRNASIGITIWGVGDIPVGGTTIKLFNDQNVLNDGLQYLRVYPHHQADCSIQSTTPGTGYLNNETFRLEKLREQYDRKEMVEVDWLDRLSFKQMARIRQEEELPLPSEPLQMFNSSTQFPRLWIDLPYFGHPIVYEEEYYTEHSHTSYFNEADKVIYDPTIENTITSSTSAGSKSMDTLNKKARSLILIPDMEIGEENPVETKYRKLAREFLRGSIDPNLKPNREEKTTIERILSNPIDMLRNDEKDLLWKFRYTLVDNRKAVTKVLLSVDWDDDEEVQQITDLLGRWAAPIDIADALKLLGRQKEFKHDIVRRFAVATISQASDNELLDYLLQLVQALRYESASLGPNMEENKSDIGPLAKFLIDRSTKGFLLANYFYWYLKVELDDPNHGTIFRTVFETMIKKMKMHSGSSAIYEMLSTQDEYISHIASIHNNARNERGKKDQKEEKLKLLLKDMNWPKGLHIRIPLDPTIEICGLVPSSTKIFKSALYPAVIEFKTTAIDNLADEDINQPENLRESLSRKRPAKSVTRMTHFFGGSDAPGYKVMFKKGDDLRQDQLIMQMFILMDRLLKKVNLDLKLTYYRILATSSEGGLMEFVLNSCPVSQVVASYETPQILSFLRKHNPDANAEYGVSPVAMNIYVKSVAGYCVLTYLLGIGDRHLDNLMMKTEGHLFHIDFGCIFGRDPKPYPPPFKLTKEMVEGMGGLESEHYVRFKTYCCQAYNLLRKSASLILNLLNLMVDAGIEELSTDPETTLAKVQEKFRLDLSDEQAEQFFLGLVNDSVTSLFPVFMEYIHKVATKLR